MAANETQAPAKTSRKTAVTGILIMAAVIVLTFAFVFRKVSPAEMWSAVQSVNPLWLLLGLVMMLIYQIGEGMNLIRPLRLFGYPLSIRHGLKYAMAGFFFSSITPSSSGGQPMQLYYMHTDGVKISHGVLALLVQLLGFETATVTLAVAGDFVLNAMLIQALGRQKLLLLVGIVINILFLLFILLCLFSEKAIRLICRILTRMIRFFDRKGKGKIAGRLQKIIDDYGHLSGSFHGHMDMIARTVATSFIQFFCMYMVPFLVYKGFGLHGSNLIQVELLQAVLFVAVGFIPIPGASGVSEGTFLLIFRLLFPGGILASAMLLSRMISLYLIVIINGIIISVLTQRTLTRRARRR